MPSTSLAWVGPTLGHLGKDVTSVLQRRMALLGTDTPSLSSLPHQVMPTPTPAAGPPRTQRPRHRPLSSSLLLSAAVAAGPAASRPPPTPPRLPLGLLRQPCRWSVPPSLLRSR